MRSNDIVTQDTHVVTCIGPDVAPCPAVRRPFARRHATTAQRNERIGCLA